MYLLQTLNTNKIIQIPFLNCRPRQLSQYSDWLRAGRSGDRTRWGEIFGTCPDRPWGPASLLYNRYRVFPGGKKRPRREADPSPPSSAVGHKRVKLYLYSPYDPYGLQRASVPVQGCILPFFMTELWTLKGSDDCTSFRNVGSLLPSLALSYLKRRESLTTPLRKP